MVFDIEKVNIFVTVPKENVDEEFEKLCAMQEQEL